MAAQISKLRMAERELLICLIAVLVAISGCKREDDNALPLAIVASASGGMQLDTCWFLSVNYSRRASLVVGHRNPQVVEFTIPQSDFDEIRKCLKGYHSWDSTQYFGYSAPDEVVRQLLISVGARSFLLSYHSLDKNLDTDRSDLEHFIFLRHKVRGWLDIYGDQFEMMDLREYELNCLKRLDDEEEKGRSGQMGGPSGFTLGRDPKKSNGTRRNQTGEIKRDGGSFGATTE